MFLLLLSMLLACSTTSDVSPVSEVTTSEVVPASSVQTAVPCSQFADDGSCIESVTTTIVTPATQSATVVVTPTATEQTTTATTTATDFPDHQ